MKNFFWSFFLIILGTNCAIENSETESTNNLKPIAKMVKDYKSKIGAKQSVNLFQPVINRSNVAVLNENDTLISKVTYFQPNLTTIKNLVATKTNFITTYIDIDSKTRLKLDLVKSKGFTDEYKVFASSNPNKNIRDYSSLHYWGIVNDNINSLTAISIFANGEISGSIEIDNVRYNLGKYLNKTAINNTHVIYAEHDVINPPIFTCNTVTELDKDLKNKKTEIQNKNVNAQAGACVREYVEASSEMYAWFGNNTTQVKNYVEGLYNIVTLLYANDNIELKLNEVKIWDTPDPYNMVYNTGVDLPEFRNKINVSYNGDHAHFLSTPPVGYSPGGQATACSPTDPSCETFGILCDVPKKRTAISYLYRKTVPGFPTYSWEVNVTAHEIGHNLGSRHTHACVWNGNNTAIDGCAGTEGACIRPPRPPGGGTIMSYCHLSSTGINWNNGFGPQPKARMQSHIAASSCLNPCSPAPPTVDAGISAIIQPTTTPCITPVAPQVKLKNFGTTTLTSVTIEYFVDSNTPLTYSWTGSLAGGADITVTLSNIALPTGTHTFTARTKNPNGITDGNTGNDSTTITYNYDVTACECNFVDKSFPTNPLVRASGTGSVSTTLTFTEETKNVVFTISNIGASLQNANSKRYVEKVTVTYVDEADITKQYGIYNGSIQSTVKIKIPSVIKSVTAKLENGYSSSYNGNLSVNLSTVNVCEVQ